MKRLIVFMLCICVVIPSLMFSSYAETLQGESDENITEERQKEYDSVNIPDSELTNILNEHREKHEKISEWYGEQASEKMGFDIDMLLESDGFVKVYNNASVLEELVSGKDIYSVVERATPYIFKLFPMKENEYSEDNAFANNGVFYVDKNDGEGRFSEYIIKGYAVLQEYVLNPQKVFLNTEATKNLDNLTVSNVIFIDNFKKDNSDAVSFLIYYETNLGDYVYYAPSFVTVSGAVEQDKIYDASFNDFLLPADEFYGLIAKSKKISDFFLYGKNFFGERLYDIYSLADISYVVGEPVFPENIGAGNIIYDLGVGLGYSCYMDFEKAVQLGGFETVEAFKAVTEEEGCITYDECRALLDEAIEARKNPPPVTSTPSGGGDTTQNMPDEGGKYNFLFWLIPSVLVVLAAAVAIFIVKKKKKA